MKNWQLAIRLFLFLLVCSTVLVFFLTAFYPAKRALANTPTPTLPDDLDVYLAKSEEAIGCKKGTEKSISWFHDDHRVTDLSIIYLHGFSASRREISPVTEYLAQRLQANVFFTRLEGHGLSSDDMGLATSDDWIRDANEAFAIGKRIGKKVIIVGTSTGAALALHLARNNSPEIEALIFTSANFRPRTAVSWMASGPLGKYIARLLIGKYLSFVPKNEQQAYFWTYKYPSSAVTELMDLLKYINTIDFTKIRTPLLMIYTELDKVISVERIKKEFTNFGSPRKRILCSESPNHVLAGDIISPEWTQSTIQEIYEFIKPD